MEIHNIDLHYHAGQERAEGLTLRDHLEHARLTGRRVIGVTDHLGLYLEPRTPPRPRPYAISVEGLLHYRRELDELKPAFPEMKLYFAPEIGPGQDLRNLPDAVIEQADFFIGEAAFTGDDPGENTVAAVKRLGELREFSARSGREVFMAHPFRAAVNYRLIKRDAEPWVYNMAPRWDGRFPAELAGKFFMLDLETLAEAAVDYGIPLEINGNTHIRIRSANLPAPLQLLWRALEVLRDKGVEFVPGSDQHGFKGSVGRIGGYVPADCFAALGLGVRDVRFLDRVAAGGGYGCCHTAS